MTITDEKLAKAMDLLYWVEDHLGERPDTEWFRSYYLLTGNHMILTEAGWEDGEAKEDYMNEDGSYEGVLDEVNGEDGVPPSDLSRASEILQPDVNAGGLFLLK